MPQYGEETGQVLDRLFDSGLNEELSSAIRALLEVGSSDGETMVQDYDGMPPDEGTTLLTVGAEQTLTVDPGTPVIIWDTNAPAANVTVEAASGQDRVLVAGGGDDAITVTGGGNVTVETGGGNDTVITGEGTDQVVITGGGASSVNTGEGGDTIVISGSGAPTVDAGGGNDTIRLASDQGQATVDGGTGFDTAALDDARGNHRFTVQDGIVVLNSAPTQLDNVEVVQYNDGISIIADNANEAIVGRLYEVLFDREADVPGLEYWLDALESGMSISGIANSFVESQEFQDANASVSNEAFLANLYQGMAGREADQAGLEFWLTQMEENNFSKADVAVSFAQSAEAIELMGIDGNQYIIDIFDISG